VKRNEDAEAENSSVGPYTIIFVFNYFMHNIKLYIFIKYN